MSSDEKTRVAIVRCDTHTYWFGVFMDEVDVLALATPHDDAPKRPTSPVRAVPATAPIISNSPAPSWNAPTPC